MLNGNMPFSTLTRRVTVGFQGFGDRNFVYLHSTTEPGSHHHALVRPGGGWCPAHNMCFL